MGGMLEGDGKILEPTYLPGWDGKESKRVRKQYMELIGTGKCDCQSA